MTCRTFILAVAALAAAMPARPARAQIEGVDHVIRRGDRRALVLVLDDDLPQGPVSAQTFALIDLRTRTLVPLATATRTAPPECPGPGGAGETGNHLCLELADGAPALDDAASYALVASSLTLAPGHELGPGTLHIEPVGGAVQKPGEEAPNIVAATYTLDLSGRSDLDTDIRIDGRSVPIDTTLNPRVEGMPLCYRRANFDIACRLGREFRNGDTVEVRLVNRGTDMPAGLPQPKPAVAKVAPPDSRDEAKIYASGGFSRVDGEEEGTLEFTLREFPVYHFGHAAENLEGWLTPYADLSLSTADEGGRLDLGAQLTTRFREVAPWLPLVDLRLTPRRESDQKNEINNWIYADVEARLFLVPLYTGPLPSRGTYHVIPRVGYERGVTTEGEDVTRLEADDPSRFNAGVEATASWPAGWLTGGKVLFLADWQIDRIRVRDATEADQRWPQRFTLQGTLQLTREFGLSITRRKGRKAPSFVDESTFEIGGTLMR